MIALAMQTLESSTCLRFLPRDQGQTFYVTIKKNDAGCWAHIGQARGSLNLASQCWVSWRTEDWPGLVHLEKNGEKNIN